MRVPVLTIDGPSGAGKGTVSRALAKKLGWHYLDSGAIYRSLAVYALDKGVDLACVTDISLLAIQLPLQFVCDEQLQVKLEGIDITNRLPTEQTGAIASKIAAYPAVRDALLKKQQDFCRSPGLVADGRDMGTVVFPHAQIKVFLTASVKERALRRFKQLKEKGIDANLDKITGEIELRDQRDSAREVSPLIPADDAFYLDSSTVSIEDVVTKIMNLIKA